MKRFLEVLYRHPIRVYLACALGGFTLAVSIFYIRIYDDIGHLENHLSRQLTYKVTEFGQRYKTIEAQLDSINNLSVSFLKAEENSDLLTNSHIVKAWKESDEENFKYIYRAEKSAPNSVEVFALDDLRVDSNDNIQRDETFFEKELGMMDLLWPSFPFLFNSSPYIERVYYTSFSAMTAIYPQIPQNEFFKRLEEKFEQGLKLPFYTDGTVVKNPNQRHFVTDIYKDPISGEPTITIGMPLVINNTHLGNFGVDFNIAKLADLLPQHKIANTSLVFGDKNYISQLSTTPPSEILDNATLLSAKGGITTIGRYTVIYQQMENGLGTAIMWLPTADTLTYSIHANAMLFIAVLFVGAVCFTIGLIVIKTSLKRLNGTLRKLDDKAHRDELTKIANRRYFIEAAEDEYAKACRQESSFSLLLLDIDKFKKINDSHGHLAGDNVLTTVSQVLKTNMRNTDLVARWGGEEFIVLPSVHEFAHDLAEKLRHSVEEAEFPYVSDVTVSIGAVYCSNAAKYSKNSLFEIADRALYKAKDAGRNCVVIENV